MADQKADFTLTFRGLSELGKGEPIGEQGARSFFADPAAFDAWANGYGDRLHEEGLDEGMRLTRMRGVNPRFIPRNHRVQEAITALVDRDDEGPLEALLAVTATPFEDHTGHTGHTNYANHAEYAKPPQPNEVVHQTFCGT
jgi:uncharacterized protein YdiU (UPF0061 family)